MEAIDYQFPKIRAVDIAFPTFDAPRFLLDLAKERGYYNGNTAANDLFDKWFFGELEKTPEFKKGVNKKKAQRAMDWTVCFMKSFAPKHQEKEAICALIFDECLEF